LLIDFIKMISKLKLETKYIIVKESSAILVLLTPKGIIILAMAATVAIGYAFGTVV